MPRTTTERERRKRGSWTTGQAQEHEELNNNNNPRKKIEPKERRYRLKNGDAQYLCAVCDCHRTLVRIKLRPRELLPAEHQHATQGARNLLASSSKERWTHASSAEGFHPACFSTVVSCNKKNTASDCRSNRTAGPPVPVRKKSWKTVSWLFKVQFSVSALKFDRFKTGPVTPPSLLPPPSSTSTFSEAWLAKLATRRHCWSTCLMISGDTTNQDPSLLEPSAVPSHCHFGKFNQSFSLASVLMEWCVLLGPQQTGPRTVVPALVCH